MYFLKNVNKEKQTILNYCIKTKQNTETNNQTNIQPITP